MNLSRKKVWAGSAVLGLVGAGLLVGCSSDADTASRNISNEAEQFKVQRKIVGVNGITDTFAFYVEGRCSIETADSMVQGALEVTCKHGENDYKKHYLGPSDNVYWVATQLEGIDVSVYHTKIVIKPEGLIPEVELQGGKQ